MKIKSAEFVISNAKVNALPQHDMPEYAFIGRSNVGKSSLINAIAGNKNLAKTSQKPGKTLLMNHFLINGEWYLVDLPGYGYASVSKKMRDDLEKMIKSYVLQREALTNLFVLIDSRHEPQAIDLEFLDFLGVNGIPFSIIFTKNSTQWILFTQILRVILYKFISKTVQNYLLLPDNLHNNLYHLLLEQDNHIHNIIIHFL